MESIAAPMSAPALYPSLSTTALKHQFVGQRLQDIPAPAAIINAAAVRRSCKLMLESAQKLGVGFRAHVKTHKTLEITKLSVGDAPLPVKLVASTVSEIENLLPWLLECREQGREINIIYGLPVTPSAIPRLASMVRRLGPGSLGLFVDHPDHIHLIERAATEVSWPGKVPIFINIDIGDHREGVLADSKQLADIASALATSTRTQLEGMYTHLGGSYSGSSPDDALTNLCRELEGLEQGARTFLANLPSNLQPSPAKKLTLSVGATPTATSAQNLLDENPAQAKYQATLDALNRTFSVELHAGVYTTLDLQQIATRARLVHSPSNPSQTLLSYDDIAFRILAEVASTYTDRGEKPEALVAAGCIALGREPCKSYSGWGVVTPWPAPATTGSHYDFEGSRTGWIVGRVSQEHGILVWEGETADGIRELRLGDKVMIWPNHACIAGVNFGWFLVVDEEIDGGETVRDVWVRWRGW